jgi:hypothetical protein
MLGHWQIRDECHRIEVHYSWGKPAEEELQSTAGCCEPEQVSKESRLISWAAIPGYVCKLMNPKVWIDYLCAGAFQLIVRVARRANDKTSEPSF